MAEVAVWSPFGVCGGGEGDCVEGRPELAGCCVGFGGGDGVDGDGGG